MRFILFLFVFISNSFANFLQPSEAFKVNTTSNKQAVFIDMKLADGIFLYKNSLKLLLNKEDITALVNLPQAAIKDKEEVYFNAFNLNIPKILIDTYTQEKNTVLQFYYQGCSKEGFCYRPQQLAFSLTKNKDSYSLSPLKEIKKNANTSSEENLIANFLANEKAIFTLISFFGYGLLLSLTPCSLPMIPILSSLIIAKGGAKNSKKYNFFLSFIYVFSMSLTYALAGIVASFLGASIQGILQKPAVLIFFAVLFLFFALVMFGAFRFELPSKLQALLQKKTNQGKGVLSIAFMGLLSALIVGPCISAPLAGALLYIADSKDVLLGGAALFIMSFAMGLPLLLVGLGISFIKPGIWMQKITFFFGFVMLAMALWILSRLIPENITLLAFGILGVFFVSFMGLFENNENPFTLIKKSVLILILTYALSLFLGGLFGAKDFLNPFHFSNTNKEKELDFKYLPTLQSIQEILLESSQKVMLDFTATWCANCKLLDEITFKDEKVIEKLKEYKLFKIDLSEGNKEQLAIMKEFGVFAPPVLIFFENGTEQLKVIGFIQANELLEKLQ
ncbi:protein-disulfide reductase DsbD [Campylobacter sp. MIT 21-1685]|uniref:protein-disulfide reductase DsbD n=1 Tax=unclassified Campylobacter TaxID=2593542 RepID=UPI00224AF48E|nr:MULTISPECIES: protein-disulfide reductase DsbD [unclassified Campylobacter]MCX2683122.1 protein-disulfide reductase DsbD [Campylobacter sp. MIT 21-1684]MCX2751418.1 protein-disulfide reductase DsbD [Campylobacter sp. MIT 21-1682]MCX2807618.1 protein-disulfide reductase DsbD [Campylobacter sp. MIT 21-1685]